MYAFSKTTFNDVKVQFISYMSKLRLVDTYWEDCILESDIYKINIDDNVIGIFSVDIEESMLTSFYISDEYIQLSQAIFNSILDKFKPAYGYVTTNDELMLSLCMDKQVSIEMQAYFFDDDNLPIKNSNYPIETLKLSTEDDVEELANLDFFKTPYVGNEENLIYVMRNEAGVIMGAGHIERMKTQRKWGAVGMCVSENFRQMGVGRSIVTHLKNMVRQKGLIPIAGCWYYNYNSKKTLESCGFSSKTRLLKIIF